VIISAAAITTFGLGLPCGENPRVRVKGKRQLFNRGVTYARRLPGNFQASERGVSARRRYVVIYFPPIAGETGIPSNRVLVMRTALRARAHRDFATAYE